jgi:hypothetical protein
MPRTPQSSSQAEGRFATGFKTPTPVAEGRAKDAVKAATQPTEKDGAVRLGSLAGASSPSADRADSQPRPQISSILNGVFRAYFDAFI